MTEYLVRFVAGGLIVSAFAIVGDMLRPKSFGGLSVRRHRSRSPRSASRSFSTARNTSPPKAGP